MREYRVPTGHGQAELMEKRSRFIGQVWSVTTEEAAQAQLKAVREQYADANHNVYAYRIRDGNIDRCSDAGEPQGTAGQPALGVFVKEDVTDVLCVVTRYFGGTLLGAGGLIRAYGQAAKLALEAAGISVVQQWQRILLRCSYPQYERLHKIAIERGAQVEDTDFAAEVSLKLLVPQAEAEAFCAHMVDVSAGTAAMEMLGVEEIAYP